MIFALCLHAHLLQSAFQTPKLFLSPCVDKPNLFVIFLYCHSICCPQLQACDIRSGSGVSSGWRRCVCACSFYLQSPVPPHCLSFPVLTLCFVLMSSAFSPGDSGKNILENFISCTALSCKCLPQYHLPN